MMNDKVIVTDIDGVCLDWDYSARAWMKKHGYEIQQEDAYGFKDRYAMEHADGKRMVKMFNESAAIGWLTPHRDAVKYVRKLHEEHGYVFHAITSLSTDPYAVKLREENLHRVFGASVFEKIECLETGADKNEALEPYRNSECYFLEDKTENAILGQQMGLRSILMTHPYNRKDSPSGMLKASDWKTVYSYITE